MAVRDCPERSPGYPLAMSTLTEIETAVATLPRAVKARLHARLDRELAREPASKSYAEWLANLETLQKGLNLDEQKVREWQNTVRDARR